MIEVKNDFMNRIDANLEYLEKSNKLVKDMGRLLDILNMNGNDESEEK